MKYSKQTSLSLLTALSGFLLASPLAAQQSAPSGQAVAMPATTNTVLLEQSPAPETTSTAESEFARALNDPGAPTAWRHDIPGQPIVMIGQDVELKAGDFAEAVVVIGGSARVHGKVRDAVVVIGGNLEVDGEVGEAVVAIMGNISIKAGANIHRDAVAVMGGISLAEDTRIGNGAVAVMGGISALDGARIGRDAVSIGGKLDFADGAHVGGQKVSVGVGIPFPNFEWVGEWLQHCVFMLRPLAPQVGWVWVAAGVMFLLSLFVAAVLPRPVKASVDSLSSRPISSFLMGVLTLFFGFVLFIILFITLVGLVLAPFLAAALFFAAVVGKVALLEWMGSQLIRRFGGNIPQPVVAFLVGSILLTLAYLVPILGLLTYTIVTVWGLGCAVTAAFGGMRREMPETPSPKPTSPALESGASPASVRGVTGIHDPAPVSTLIPAMAPLTGMSAAAVPPAVAPTARAATAPLAAIPPVYPRSLSLPRAGFWERMGAGFLDMVLVLILSALVGGAPLGFVVALAYFAGMWAWKGTTIGGVVLKLQVVRSDGGPMTFVVAMVRGLAAAFSGMVFFLGFLWIAWDPEKQGWHDKIAGTDVVRLPRTAPLVCI